MHERLLASASNLSDDALLDRVRALAADERSCTIELIAHLAEVDTRNLSLRRGRSLYLYCIDVLHLSEHAAYTRIGAARAARRFPVILDRLADGSVNVTTVTLLAPHLTEANHLELLAEARHKTKDLVKEIVRRVDPLPPAKTVIRAVAAASAVTAAAPASTVASVATAAPASTSEGDEPSSAPSASAKPGAATPAQPEAATPAQLGAPTLPSARPAADRPKPAIEPRSPEIWRLHVDIDRETHDVVRRLQDLLARETGGDVSRIFARAALLLLKHVEREKLAATPKPRSARGHECVAGDSRYISAPVRRAVWRRDGGQCAFVGPDGRCPETRYLEWHHVLPYGHQGPPTVENISLRCRAHNALEAELVFGKFGVGAVRETASIYGMPGVVRKDGSAYSTARRANSVWTEYER